MRDTARPRARPAQRATPLEGTPPATTLSPGLTALCHSGERAVTVFCRPGAGGRAALGSPMDPEAFTVWRTQGVYVFLRGEVPEALDLGLDTSARVAVTARYHEEEVAMNDAGETIDFEVDGVAFELRVHPDPSGLRGQVFRGDEKVAGVQVSHRADRAALLAEARRDRAVARAAARATES